MTWLDGYNQLSEAQKDRVQRWLHLNKFIAHTLRLPWKEWVDDYLAPSMRNPMDYSFMAVTIPGFIGLDVEGQGASFTRSVDPSAPASSRVPLRARNNLARLSPAVQEGLRAMLEGKTVERVKLTAADVATLQKIFPGERALSKLKKAEFRSLHVAREEDEVVLVSDAKGRERAIVLRINVIEFGALMSRPLM